MSFQEFSLPDVGEGLTEAEIITWKVHPGEHVALNQAIVEIETAKSLVELPSPFTGTVDQLLVAEGQTVEVGTPIIRVRTAAETPAAPGSAPEGSSAPDQIPSAPAEHAGESVAADASAQSQTGSLVGSGPTRESSKRKIRRGRAKTSAKNSTTASATPAGSSPVPAGASAAPDQAPSAPASSVPAPGSLPVAGSKPGAIRVLAKPPVRKIAKDLGVDLDLVPATGARGEVTRADLERHVRANTLAKTPASTPTGPSAPHLQSQVDAPAPTGHVPAQVPPVQSQGGLTQNTQSQGTLAQGTQSQNTQSQGTLAQGTPSAPHIASANDLPLGSDFWVDATPGDPDPAAREFREPVRGVRKATAKSMVASAFSAPHVSIFVDVDASRTMEFVKRLKESRDFEGIKVSPLLILAKAVIWATARNPQVNATWSDTEIIVHRYMNLGIAAATPRGLLVPNIKNAQDLSLKELAIALNTLAQKARAGQSTPADMRSGTMTITNIGALGIDTGTPIINPGEVAIIAFGTIKQKPWVLGGEVIPRWVTTLGGSFDHRVVDGDLSARFMADVASILEEPAMLLD